MHKNEYTKKNGIYRHFNSLGNESFSSERIAVLYDYVDSVLLKHGPPESVQREYDKLKGIFGDSDLFNFKIVISDKWSVEELNKIISISGYIKFFETDQNRFVEE